MRIIAHTSEDLWVISDFVHDCWFDIGLVVWESEREQVSVPIECEDPERAITVFRLGPVTRKRVPVVRYLLHIQSAVGCFREDSEKVGRYDINEVRYDAGRSVVSVTTNIPSVMEAQVRRVDVVLEETSTIVRHVLRWRSGRP